MMHLPPSPPLYSSSDSNLPEPVPNRSRNCMERYYFISVGSYAVLSLNSYWIFLSYSASAKRSKFIKRLFKLRHMDFQFAMWQMIYLFISPQKVFRDFVYRKQTKNQFARDDPAFLVLLSLILLVTSVLFGLVMHLSFFNIVKFVIWVVFIDCIGVGLLIATLYWFVANKFLLKNPKSNLDVEWAYCFDVHLNAFLPMVVILHLIQLPFLMTIISYEWVVSAFFGNTFWLVAISYYFYNLFLGFKVLPFLRNTKVLLYPFTLLLFVYILTIILNINLSVLMMNAYEYRLLSWSP